MRPIGSILSSLLVTGGEGSTSVVQAKGLKNLGLTSQQREKERTCLTVSGYSEFK